MARCVSTLWLPPAGPDLRCALLSGHEGLHAAYDLTSGGISRKWPTELPPLPQRVRPVARTPRPPGVEPPRLLF